VSIFFEKRNTPNQAEPNFKNKDFPIIFSAKGRRGDMFMNYMNYVDDDSMYMFTGSAGVRMRTARAEARPALG
jgi:hypothetical protein